MRRERGGPSGSREKRWHAPSSSQMYVNTAFAPSYIFVCSVHAARSSVRPPAVPPSLLPARLHDRRDRAAAPLPLSLCRRSPHRPPLPPSLACLPSFRRPSSLVVPLGSQTEGERVSRAGNVQTRCWNGESSGRAGGRAPGGGCCCCCCVGRPPHRPRRPRCRRRRSRHRNWWTGREGGRDEGAEPEQQGRAGAQRATRLLCELWRKERRAKSSSSSREWASEQREPATDRPTDLLIPRGGSERARSDGMEGRGTGTWAERRKRGEQQCALSLSFYLSHVRTRNAKTLLCFVVPSIRPFCIKYEESASEAARPASVAPRPSATVGILA